MNVSDHIHPGNSEPVANGAPSAVPTDIAGLLAAEWAIMEEYGLYQPSLPPGKPVAHYVDIYRKSFLDPKLDRFDSMQRMGFNKLSQPDAPAAGTPECSRLLCEHRLSDPMPSKHCLMDYLDDYREYGDKGKFYQRLSPRQRE